MRVQQKRQDDSEFKRNAVMLLSEEPDRTVPEMVECLGTKKQIST